MSKGVMAPLVLTGIVVGVSQGWLEAVWTWIYTATHTGNAPPPLPTHGTVNQVIGGGDASGLGKNPANVIPPDIIPGNPFTNPNIS